MDEILIENWNSVVKPKDTIYHLGDVSWYGSDTTNTIFKQLNGHKHLILGNHDHLKNLSPYFETITDYRLIKVQTLPIVLFHYPILSWNLQNHGSLHLHGHTHDTIDNCGILRFDVGVDSWNMKPVNLEQIINLIPTRLAQNPSKLQRPVEKFDAMYKRAIKDGNSNLTKMEFLDVNEQ